MTTLPVAHPDVRPFPQIERVGSVPSTPWYNLLARPSVFICALFAVAICFERAVEVEVFKPYRIIGGVLVFAALIKGRLLIDRFARLAIIYIFLGVLLALLHVVLQSVPVIALQVDSALWIFNIATYVAITSLLRSKKEVMIVLLAHTFGMIVATYDIVTHAAELQTQGMIARVSGDFKNPAHACLSLMLTTVVVLTIMRWLMRRRRGGFGKLVVAVAGAGIVLFELYASSLTGSRAGAGLFVVGILVYLLTSGRRRTAFIAAIVAIGVAGVMTQLDAWPKPPETNILAKRVETKGFDTARFYLWRSGLDACASTYGMGLGLGQYRTVHMQFFSRYMYQSDERWAEMELSLHNDFVTALVEFGILGFFIFLAICKRIWRLASGIRDGSVRSLALALIAGCVINALSHSVFPYFGLWFYLALLALWSRFESVERVTNRPAAA